MNKEKEWQEFFTNKKESPTYFTADHAISMTLRDYFAGQALSNQAGENSTTATVKYCYELADAMLKEREK
jgi:hypothetical protein